MMDEILKIFAGLLLAVILGGVVWALSHVRRIRRKLEENEALPREGPRQNILVLITAVLLGLSGLILAYLLH